MFSKLKKMNTTHLPRAIVWLVVTIWCLAPLAWLVLMLTDGGIDFPLAFLAPRPGPGPADKGTVKFLATLVMMMFFTYGMWCIVGIIMGFGADRAITVAESLTVDLFLKPKPVEAHGDLDDLEEVNDEVKQPTSGEAETVPCPD